MGEGDGVARNLFRSCVRRGASSIAKLDLTVKSHKGAGFVRSATFPVWLVTVWKVCPGGQRENSDLGCTRDVISSRTHASL